MPPSSQRKTRARKQPEPVDRSDADEGDFVATPTRKRRKVNYAEPAQSPVTDIAVEVPVSTSAQRRKTRSSDIKPDETEDVSLNEDDSETVIRHLRHAKYDIRAKIDFANEVQEVAHPGGKTAYAKIAGNGWTFYVDDLEIRIGRPPDERQADDGPADGAYVAGGVPKSHVHIDLGPSKIISRLHAEIAYNSDQDQWHISVNGRNGLKLDEMLLHRGQTAPLHSGSVIDVAGTQMMFVTPNVEPVIHPAIAAQVHTPDDDDDDDDDAMNHNNHNANNQRTPLRGPGARSAANRMSSAHGGGPTSHHASRGSTRQAVAPQYLHQHDATSDVLGQGSMPASKASPAYSRGVMLETTEDIDYSLESAKDLKPPHSYAQLIGMAILASPEEKLTLSKIYEWIKEHYAFYRFSGGGWQNSIRHNLSLNKCFEKIARRTDEPGKGMKWQIVQEHRDDFVKRGLSSVRKPNAGGRGSSGPDSPGQPGPAVAAADRGRSDDPFQSAPATGTSYQQASRRPSHYIKHSPGSTPPQITVYPQSGGAASTPDRARYPSPRFTSGVSPVTAPHGRYNGLNEAAAAGSPGGPTMLLGSDPNDHFATPLVTRHAPKLVPPSTAHLPSQFMPMSSPAPFWKYADFGSTPARPHANNAALDMSPDKTAKHERPSTPTATGPGDSTIEGKGSGVQSSSPPVGHESPTRQVASRSSDRAMAPVSAMSAPAARISPAAPSHETMVTAPAASVAVNAADDDEEEDTGMIDLARGFQPIGSFHRSMNASVIRGS